MIWGVGYGVVALIVAGVGARKVLWSARDSYGDLGVEDYFFSCLSGLMIGAFWPLTVVGVGASRLLRRDLEKNHPDEVAYKQMERQHELDERQRRIEELERELGIGERY